MPRATVLGMTHLHGRRAPAPGSGPRPAIAVAGGAPDLRATIARWLAETGLATTVFPPRVRPAALVLAERDLSRPDPDALAHSRRRGTPAFLVTADGLDAPGIVRERAFPRFAGVFAWPRDQPRLLAALRAVAEPSAIDTTAP